MGTVLSLTQIARRFGRTRQTIYNWTKGRGLPPELKFPTGFWSGRTLLFELSEIEAFEHRFISMAPELRQRRIDHMNDRVRAGKYRKAGITDRTTGPMKPVDETSPREVSHGPVKGLDKEEE